MEKWHCIFLAGIILGIVVSVMDFLNVSIPYVIVIPIEIMAGILIFAGLIIRKKEHVEKRYLHMEHFSEKVEKE